MYLTKKVDRYDKTIAVDFVYCTDFFMFSCDLYRCLPLNVSFSFGHRRIAILRSEIYIVRTFKKPRPEHFQSDTLRCTSNRCEKLNFRSNENENKVC